MRNWNVEESQMKRAVLCDIYFSYISSLAPFNIQNQGLHVCKILDKEGNTIEKIGGGQRIVKKGCFERFFVLCVG